MSRRLILGGARSGKSALAERLARASGKHVVYVATSQAGDAEMAIRIEQHRARRPAHWRTVEEPAALAACLSELCASERIVLVDCMTLWLSNVMFPPGRHYPEVGAIDPAPLFVAERAALLAWLDAPPEGEVIFVSNEVGMGIVPFGAVSRAFADEAGRLNQDLAARCEHVTLVAAGLPLTLKGRPC